MTTGTTAPTGGVAGASRPVRWPPPAVVVGALTAAGLLHVGLVALRYHVGSFDDDAAYLYMARGLAHGTGLAGRLPNGYPLLWDYPPGYPALLAPLVLAFPGFLAERLLSVACTGALYPMTWVWLRRSGVGERQAAAVLALLALNPVLATFGSMVTPDVPFVVLLLLLVLVADRHAVTTILVAAATVWVKEAGLAVAGGVVLWLVWTRRWARAAVTATALALLVLPLVLARLSAGVAVAGARYTGEIAGTSLLDRLTGALQFVFYAVYAGVTPVDSPLADHWATLVVFAGLASASAAVFCAVGAVAWWRRQGTGDAVIWIVAAYALECIAYRYVNERRTLLVLPVLAAWYVMGAIAVGRRLIRLSRQRGGPSVTAWHRGFAVAACLGAAALLVQFPVDFKEPIGHGTSRPAGSPYMTLLSHLGPPRSPVATDYLWTTALFTGHPGAKDAFYATYGRCSPAAALRALRRQHAAYGLVAALNGRSLDDRCLGRLAEREPWAVPLLRTDRDDATVFEVIGPGTAHPDLRLLRRGRSGLLPAGATVTQITLGPSDDARIQVLTSGGWRTVAASRGRRPWTLVHLDTPAWAVRVTGRAGQLAVLGRIASRRSNCSPAC